MCKYKYDVDTAARMLRDKVNESWTTYGTYEEGGKVIFGPVTHYHRGADRISLADAKAYCLDVRDNLDRMEEWRDGHPTEHYPGDLLRWERSHRRKLFTVQGRGPAYCRMVLEEQDLRVNATVR